MTTSRDVLQISFSGGETSAFMTQLILPAARKEYRDVVVVFANTGQENEQTLEFVDRCDKHFGFGVVWLETKVRHGVRKGSTHTIVDYETACRDGRVFEEYIKKYGIPNQAFPQCTRELKTNPMKSYMKSLGYMSSQHLTAIGIRADEAGRASKLAEKNGFIYPLIEMSITKKDVNAYWRDMPFRLELKGFEGNCKWCWKKTKRKHFTLMSERPEIYDFPARMEALYRDVGPQNDERVFFRGKQDTAGLRAEYESVKDSFEPFHDDARVYDDEDLDRSGGCSESCEIGTALADEEEAESVFLENLND